MPAGVPELKDRSKPRTLHSKTLKQTKKTSPQNMSIKISDECNFPVVGLMIIKPSGQAWC